MAIRFPKKNLPPNLNIQERVTTVTTEHVGLRPVKKAVDKKQLALLGALLLVGLGALAYWFLPSLLEKDEPTPPPKVVANKSVPVASAPKIMASQTAANTASAASTANPNQQATNQQTIVITGDHLKNGVSSASAPQSVEATNTTINKQPEHSNATVGGEVAFAGEENPVSTNNNTSKDQISRNTKSTISYAEFVKASEMTVYREEGSNAAPATSANANK